MIEIVFGEGVGSGKSFYVTARRLIPHLCRGGTIYHSDTYVVYFDKLKEHIANTYGWEIEPDQLHSFPESDVPRLHEVTPMGTAECPVLVIVDEAQGELPCISGTEKKGSDRDRFFTWLCQSRHDDTDVIFITQEINNISKKIQRLATFVVVVRNMVNFKVGGLRWPLRQFRVQWKDRKMKAVQQVEWLWHSAKLFGCYESKACRGRHTRVAAMPVARKTLARASRKNRRMKFVLMFGLCAICLAGYNLYASRNRPSALKDVTPPTPPAHIVQVVQADAKPKGDFEIVTEILRYTNGTNELRSAVGHYIVGELSIHGMVEKVQGRSVLIRRPDKTLLAVVAMEEVSRGPGVVSTAKTAAAGIIEEKPGIVKTASSASPAPYKLSPAERARGGYPPE